MHSRDNMRVVEIPPEGTPHEPQPGAPPTTNEDAMYTDTDTEEEEGQGEASQHSSTLPSLFADLTPIPQQEGEPALLTIAYTAEYAQWMGWFRAVVAAREHSDRCFPLTAAILGENPSHYTVWAWRVECLRTLASGDVASLQQELAFIHTVGADNPKSYQVWRHRQGVVELLAAAYATADAPSALLCQLAAGEVTFISEMLGLDAKNYHAWSYRQWVVQAFGPGGLHASCVPADVWEGEGREMEVWLNLDVYNNSAWNHRYYWWTRYRFTRPPAASADTPELAEAMVRELDYVMRKVDLAPDNLAAWSYLQGLLKWLGCKELPVQAWALGDDGASMRCLLDTHLWNTWLPIHVEHQRAPALLFQAQWTRDAAQKQATYLALASVDGLRARFWKERGRLSAPPEVCLA
jgi:protein farnesyltransferase/geranylgeranyltransferase type-1 subunit alpha